jgi:hypothetical protein
LLRIREKEALGMTLDIFFRFVEDEFGIGVYRGFNRKSVRKSRKSKDPTFAFSTLGLLSKEIGPNRDNISSLACIKPYRTSHNQLQQGQQKVFSLCPRTFMFSAFRFEGWPGTS